MFDRPAVAPRPDSEALLRQFVDAALDQPAPTAALRAALAAYQARPCIVHAAPGTMLARMIELASEGRLQEMDERKWLGWDP